ncbi:MAG: DegT/DnrJ/EryC1/StrS family aminotransferase, partial [Bacteroidales bacterium]|nr:DegT/DnrJ/EryC1/StrS family aminotransferase [Bacteroidales bacterium]
IKMVDLRGQYMKIKPFIDDAIQEVIDTTSFIKGPDVEQFERELSEYLGCRHTISCANGTDALQIAMMALDLQPGDEVITTPFTFIATVESIKLLRLKPVLVDVEEDSFNINTGQIDRVITGRTRTIVPVHLFGQCSDMASITDLAKKHNLSIIEDNAQALGTTFTFPDGKARKSGTIGTIGTTSFFPSKNLGCYGDGGAVFTNDDKLANKIRALVNHGMFRRYYYDYIGVNSRLDSVQAAILRIKLQHLEVYNRLRREAADFYDRALSPVGEIKIPARSPFSDHIFHQYTLRVPAGLRDELQKYLESKKIPSAIYYPVPVHLQAAYRDLGYRKGDFPVSEQLSDSVISLPMHTELDEEQLEYITEAVQLFFKR